MTYAVLHIFAFLACFRAYVGQPDDHILDWALCIDLSYIHAQGPIPVIFAKNIGNWRNWKTEFFLSRPFWFFFLLHKNQFYSIERMGQSFDDYTGFHLKITHWELAELKNSVFWVSHFYLFIYFFYFEKK